jgi:hypothetical protein
MRMALAHPFSASSRYYVVDMGSQFLHFPGKDDRYRSPDTRIGARALMELLIEVGGWLANCRFCGTVTKMGGKFKCDEDQE